MKKTTRILTTTLAAILLIAGSGAVGYQAGYQVGSAPAVHTTTYSATSSSWAYTDDSAGGIGNLVLGAERIGYFSYGSNRMNELQGRTILSGRMYLPRVSGAGAVTMQVYKGGLKPSTSLVSTGGWVTVPLTRINELVQGTGQTLVQLTGSGTLLGTAAGAIQVTWSE